MYSNRNNERIPSGFYTLYTLPVPNSITSDLFAFFTNINVFLLEDAQLILHALWYLDKAVTSNEYNEIWNMRWLIFIHIPYPPYAAPKKFWNSVIHLYKEFSQT